VQYKNTNSGRRNLLNVKSHRPIKKIGFELVLKLVLSNMERRKTVPCIWPSKREGTFSELGLQMRCGVAGGVWGGTQVRACYSCRRELQCIREITWSLPNMDVIHHNIIRQSLYVIRNCTGSQCSWIKHSVTCSFLPRLKINRAAAFCTRWRGSIVDCGSADSTELQ